MFKIRLMMIGDGWWWTSHGYLIVLNLLRLLLRCDLARAIEMLYATAPIKLYIYWLTHFDVRKSTCQLWSNIVLKMFIKFKLARSELSIFLLLMLKQHQKLPSLEIIERLELQFLFAPNQGGVQISKFSSRIFSGVS